MTDTNELIRLSAARLAEKLAAGDDVPATSHPIPLNNVFREDVVGHTFTAEQALSGAPDSDENRFKVPAILDEA